MKQANNNPKTSFLYIGGIALCLAVVAVGAVLIILSGARFGFWEPIEGFRLYRVYFNSIAYVTAGVATAALVISLLLKARRSIALSSLAVVIGAALMSPIIMAMINPPVRAAPIHNISTDTENPPAFVALDDTRAGATNSLAYGGADAAAQNDAYPDIAPIQTDLSPYDAFARALSIADDMGWSIVDQRDDTFQFEATARTPVFYFADDIVVAVTPTTDGSRVDMRSVSRVGRSDQGVNAARIRAFAQAMSNPS
ncbi:DUF1499 domain-containing protein [Loktanella sp. D2R18]|uniref:DUF1499 domain-containing protein n=1 Tax=Rhodobacterales TaxID=204455 RepID=UPI000DE98FFD|nr:MULTISPECIES: DUF1499 domain-containing protein [Rhodobacterales]MDO6592191.1 DUF1499 domain-containing protein [Yoonia sp. 1_MG-2023]RBW43619.1 DUF1499 domain-containing protein [Loktanella sp. D2R18]